MVSTFTNCRLQTIIFDTDGILLEFSRKFADWFNLHVIEGRWESSLLQGNPETWRFGFTHDEPAPILEHALQIFIDEHDHLPLLHPDIPSILHQLHDRYHIEIVSAYPHTHKRIANFLHHNMPYDVMACGIHDKVSYIQRRIQEGLEVVAIFEDGPHHIDKMIPIFGGKLWAPNEWNYLKSYKSSPHIRFYDDPSEWLSLCE